jgi:uncharacterized protein involved in cysteine biosynthesis
MRYLVEGARLVFTDRTLWPYLWRPMLLGGAIYLVFLIAGFLTVPKIADWVMDVFRVQDGTARQAGNLIAYLGYALLLWFISGAIFLTGSTLVSAFMWEKLSIEVEERLGNPNPATWKVPIATMAVDGGLRFVLAMTMTILGLLCGWVVPVLGPVLIMGWLALHDFTGPSFMRRRHTLIQQMPKVYRLKGWFGFQLSCGVVTLFPFVNVLMLPAMVAGATIMVYRSEQAGTLVTR